VPPLLYVNPSCSKSRTALALLQERRVEVDTILYLDEPPTVDDLKRLMGQLGLDDPRSMMRRGEPAYDALGLDEVEGDDLLEAISRHPVLLERPIFVVGERAVIARPPERLLELL
jgi:arsenate reductase (glutaredoxin)